MPAITPTQYNVRGITAHAEAGLSSGNVPYSWTTLIEIPLNPTEACDLLVVGHGVIGRSGASRSVSCGFRVMLNNEQIGEGLAQIGSVDGSAPNAGAILGSVRDIPAGTHTLRIQGHANSTLGTDTVSIVQLSVSVVEFYR